MSNRLILYSVLDWGLGHATRSVPIISGLLRNNYQVVIAGEGRSGIFLEKEFPQCQFLPINGFKVHYPDKGMTIWALRNMNAMMKAYKSEIEQTQLLVKKYQPHMIISDHRYGFFHPEIHSIFIAHQLRIKAGILTSPLFSFHKKLLNRFNEIWVPDFEQSPGLSGTLSHQLNSSISNKLKYIGPQSRLKDVLPVMPDRNNSIVAIVSGPEPHRSLFEEMCRKIIIKSGKNGVIIRGTPDENKIITNGTVHEFSNIPAAELKGYFLSTPIIICRPGYSSIMDLYATGRNAILVPTPGQTEQEYLAHLHLSRSFTISNQKFENLETAMTHHKPVYDLQHSSDKEGMRFNMDNWLQKQIS